MQPPESNPAAATEYGGLSPEAALAALKSAPSGLGPAAVSARRAEFGLNRLQAAKKTSPLVVFLRQFLSPLIYVLLAAAVVSLVVQHFIDAFVILGVLFLNAVIGFVEERRAEAAMEALMQLAAPRATVRRDGQTREIPAGNLVPGDILILEAGDKLPADVRLIEAHNLKLNESALTGESLPVTKHVAALETGLPLAERRNQAFSGTIVTFGRGTALVTATGMQTELGRIAGSLLSVKREPTPLQQNISRISRYIVFIVLGVLALLIAVGVVRQLGLLDIFLLAVAAAVSAIPEGLPAVVTVVLAIGMHTMARRQAIIRKLVAVETLGSATVICSDKTGTLTLNQMTVRRIYLNAGMIHLGGEGYQPHGEFTRDGAALDPAREPGLTMHLRAGLLCNDALLTEQDGRAGIIGDPTEGALVVAAAKAGLDKAGLETEAPRHAEVPFASDYQYMATRHSQANGGSLIYVKGSLEKLLALAESYLEGGAVRPLDATVRERFEAANAEMAREALRVIATGYIEAADAPSSLTEADIRGRLVLVGLSGMEDPPHEEARAAIRDCALAGIRVVMITGDNRLTAQAIARQLNIPAETTVTSVEIAAMDDAALSRCVGETSVFARIEPLHKLRIVEALKACHQVVAMTGDGVNDAPALKAANIGVAMGITGTDVAKEAADMILADDNFSSIVAAIDEGRAIFNRLRSVLFFLLSTNLGELVALILSIIFVGQAPLVAVQIIWVNLVTDTAGAIPLGMEPKHGDELRQPPRSSRVGIIFPGLLLRIGFMALIMGVGITLVFNWASARYGLDEARTVAFCTMVCFEWFRAFNARTDEQTVFGIGIFGNRWLVGSILLAVGLQMAVVYLPFMQVAFHTTPLAAGPWAVALAAAGSLFVIEELRKILLPRLFSRGKWRASGEDEPR